MVEFWKSIIERPKKVISNIHSVSGFSLVSKRGKKRIVLNEGYGFEQWRIENFSVMDHLFRWILFIWIIVLCKISWPKQILLMSVRAIFKHVEIKPEVHRLLFFLGELVHLVDSNFSFYNFSLNFFSIWTVTEIFHIRRLQRCSRIFKKLFFYRMHTSQSRFVVLSLYHRRFILFIHAFDRLTTVALEILVTWLNWVSDVNNFLFSKIFEIHIFCTVYLFLVFMNFYFHFVDKTDSNRV